jgi:hypothetical protein
MTGVSAPETVKCLRRNYLESSGEFVKSNVERVLSDRTEYQRRPLFFFREVVSEFRTMDSIDNVVREAAGEFSLLNDN